MLWNTVRVTTHAPKVIRVPKPEAINDSEKRPLIDHTKFTTQITWIVAGILLTIGTANYQNNINKEINDIETETTDMAMKIAFEFDSESKFELSESVDYSRLGYWLRSFSMHLNGMNEIGLNKVENMSDTMVLVSDDIWKEMIKIAEKKLDSGKEKREMVSTYMKSQAEKNRLKEKRGASKFLNAIWIALMSWFGLWSVLWNRPQKQSNQSAQSGTSREEEIMADIAIERQKRKWKNEIWIDTTSTITSEITKTVETRPLVNSKTTSTPTSESKTLEIPAIFTKRKSEVSKNDLIEKHTNRLANMLKILWAEQWMIIQATAKFKGNIDSKIREIDSKDMSLSIEEEISTFKSYLVHWLKQPAEDIDNHILVKTLMWILNDNPDLINQINWPLSQTLAAA